MIRPNNRPILIYSIIFLQLLTCSWDTSNISTPLLRPILDSKFSFNRSLIWFYKAIKACTHPWGCICILP